MSNYPIYYITRLPGVVPKVMFKIKLKRRSKESKIFVNVCLGYPPLEVQEESHKALVAVYHCSMESVCNLESIPFEQRLYM